MDLLEILKTQKSKTEFKELAREIQKERIYRGMNLIGLDLSVADLGFTDLMNTNLLKVEFAVDMISTEDLDIQDIRFCQNKIACKHPLGIDIYENGQQIKFSNKDIKKWAINLSYIITISNNNECIFWNMYDGSLLYSMSLHKFGSSETKISVADEYVSVFNDITVLVFNSSGEKIEIGEEKCHSVAFYSHYIATTTMTKTIKVWNINNSEIVFVLTENHHLVSTLAFDNSVLVLGDLNECVRIWDMGSGSPINFFKQASSIVKIILLDNLIISQNKNHISIMNLKQEISVIHLYERLNFTDGLILLSSNGQKILKRNLKIQILNTEMHRTSIELIAFSKSNKLASYSRDSIVLQWNIAKRAPKYIIDARMSGQNYIGFLDKSMILQRYGCIRVFQKDHQVDFIYFNSKYVPMVSFSEDNSKFIYSDDMKIIYLYDILANTVVKSFEVDEMLTAIALSSSAALFAYSHRKAMKVLNWENLEVYADIYETNLKQISINEEKMVLVTLSFALRVWNIYTGEIILQHNTYPPSPVHISNKYVAFVIYEKRLGIWNYIKNRIIFYDFNHSISSLAISKYKKMLAYGTTSGSVNLLKIKI